MTSGRPVSADSRRLDMRGSASAASTVSTPTDDGRSRRREGFEVALTVLSLALTAVACALLAVECTAVLRETADRGDAPGTLGQLLFMLIVALLLWGNLVYQLTRLAYFLRRLNHQPAPAWLLEEFSDGTVPSLTILVPSYKEEPSVVQRTLFSAALQDYPYRRVVLLIDDPAHPDNLDDARALRRIQSLPIRLQSLFVDATKRFGRECAAYERRRSLGATEPLVEARRIGRLYEEAAQWLDEQASRLVSGEPGDELLRDKVFLPLAQAHRVRALRVKSDARSGALEEAQVLREYH